jgi:hypothetical protein
MATRIILTTKYWTIRSTMYLGRILDIGTCVPAVGYFKDGCKDLRK